MISIFRESFNKVLESFDWVWKQIIFDVEWYNNFFYGLILISLLVYALELLFPWRKYQKAIRKDFWMDTFYMFFNFFIFSSAVTSFYYLINYFLGESLDKLAIVDVSTLPIWLGLLLFFTINDFVQWFTHVLLHRFSFLWQFHKVHHSVKEMGFAAHLRYHWMENILYRPLKTLVIFTLVGGKLENLHYVYLAHFTSILIGHLNHANVKITWGPLRYIFNNSVMHLWHHSKNLPSNRKYGMNYAISLSIWDYIFRTNYIPHDSGDIELGFENDEQFPKSNFWKQLIYPIGKKD